MNEKQNAPRWFQTKCECGEIRLIDSEKFPGFFSVPDNENGLSWLSAICPKCLDTIEITRDNIGSTVVPSRSTPDKPLLKWELKWE